MNTKKWLALGLSVALAGCLGWAVAACAPTEPNPNEGDNPSTPHTHTFTGWDHSDTEHWRVCPDDGEIDVTTRAPHVFVGGECECGMKEADITPDEGRDTRSFWVVGSGAGDLSKCSFTELKSNFKLTKQPKKDANGYTVYTTSALTLYAGDTMKIVQDLDWDDGLGYFGVTDIKNNNDGSFVDGGTGNISPAKGKDGKYIFTVRTKKDIAFSDCTLEFKLVEPVAALTKTEEIYIVGSLRYYSTKWPSGTDVTGCKKLDYDEATGEWSITLRLGGATNELGKSDEFKLYNAVNKKYIPDGTGNNWTVSGTADGKNKKASGDYKISWKSGDTDVTFTLLPHEHNYDDNRIARDDDGHFTACWLDDTEKEGTRQEHDWENDGDTRCDTCGYERHVHTYDQWGKNETQHWKQCADGAIDESTRQDHVYDQPGNKCVCGQEQGAEACKHDGKINFTYTADNLPAQQEEGGTLHGTCATCSEEVDIPYDKIGSIDTAPGLATGKPSVMVEGGHAYYIKHNHGTKGSKTGVFFGYKIEQAGTLTLRINLVYGNGYADGNDLKINLLTISETENGSLSTSSESKGDLLLVKLTNRGKWNSDSTGFAKWKEQMTFTPEMNETEAVTFESMTVTFKDEDIGKYMYMIVGPTASLSDGTPKGMMFLVDATFAPTPAAASVAPAEVALLPERKD